MLYNSLDNCHLHICCQLINNSHIHNCFNFIKILWQKKKERVFMVGRSRKQKASGNSFFFLSFFFLSFLHICSFFYCANFFYWSLCVIQEDDDLKVEMADEGKLTYLITKLINSFSLIFGGFLVGGCFTSSQNWRATTHPCSN